MIPLSHGDQADSCQGILGQWAWFTGWKITLDSAGRIIPEEGKTAGTWECANPAQAEVVLKWMFGDPPFVDMLKLSADGQSLTGHNQYQFPVTAKRLTLYLPSSISKLLIVSRKTRLLIFPVSATVPFLPGMASRCSRGRSFLASASA